MHFSTPYLIDTIHIMTRHPMYKLGQNYFMPLSGSVWICFGLCLVVISYLLHMAIGGPNALHALLGCITSLYDVDPTMWFQNAQK